MNSLLGQLVFSVGRQQYYWDDVILSARLWGDWADLEKELREGIACLKRLDEAAEEFDPEELESAANDFRYERDLLTAEEAEAWLNRWNLSADSWMEYLQRFMLRRKWADQLVEIVARYRVTKKEIHSSLYAEAICSGHLARFARALAARASAYEKALEAGWVRDDLKSAEAAGRIRLLEASYQRFCDHVVDAQGIKNQVDSHRLDWIRFDCRYVLFYQEQMAREAALCARDDGMQLDEVAANASLAPQNATMYLDEVEPSLRDRFLSAEKGALIGPLNWDKAFGLFLVEDKIIPAVEDPEIKQRAQETLLESAVNREINKRVKWHARL
ncbi:MAG TPA: hypothetical protein VGB27_13140 [Candidatus Binatia bacterium]